MTTLKNKDIGAFEDKLKIFNSSFLKTINGYDVLLGEIADIKKPHPLNITNDVNAYNTEQLAGFIRNIVNFQIKDYNSLTNNNTNMEFISKTTTSGSTTTYEFNNNVKTHIIETLKVINVFVDILEAYKNCIEDEPYPNNNGYKSGYTNEIIIDQIEVVSDTTRFYDAGVMFPGSQYKNVGYIRPILESDNSPKVTVLFLSIESFYNGMITQDNKYNYSNMFTKTKISSLGTIKEDIKENILGDGAKTAITTDKILRLTNYARQRYSGVEDDNLSKYNLTLEQRNKTLIVYLLKTLLNLDPNFRKQSVYALYYYYKFVQLYSTLIINVSNVMYANYRLTGSTPLRIETFNMSLTNMPTSSMSTMSRILSGIEIKTAGTGYANRSHTITFTEGGGTVKSILDTQQAVATVYASNQTIPTTSIITIANRGAGYISVPTPTIIPPTSGTQAVASVTIVPLPIEDTQKTHNENIDTLINTMTDISVSLTTLNNEFSKYVTNDPNIIDNIVITTNDGVIDSLRTKISLTTDNMILITVNKSDIITRLKELMEKEDIPNNYMLYDKINKYTYSILKIMEEGIFIKIKVNAVFIEDDFPKVNIDTKIFRDSSNNDINKPANTISVIDISSRTTDFLEIKKKDLNTYKNEYIFNRDDIAKLDENIRVNRNKVEHQKNLYDTQYNKNVFLTRQIISYNTIIAAIILILIVINMLNVDTLFIKTVSLVCLGVVILLFAVYFISNITYIETFTSSEDLSVLKSLSTLSDSEYNIKKLDILNNKISALNKTFISFFEKIIITLPIRDNIDFYKEVKGIITNDKNVKLYTNNILLLNKDDSHNNMDTLKYEMENNKLYIVSLLIATIVFLSIYNMYINYVSNDRFLSLTVFICVIILVVISSYYVIRSNRRVRTFYKNIYWGPETSVRF